MVEDSQGLDFHHFHRNHTHRSATPHQHVARHNPPPPHDQTPDRDHHHPRLAHHRRTRFPTPATLAPTSPHPRKKIPDQDRHRLPRPKPDRSEEHTSELQSLRHLVCR